MSPIIVFTVCAITHGVALLSYLYFYSKSGLDKAERLGEDESIELLSKDGSV
jgi:hypothetical protein